MFTIIDEELSLIAGIQRRRSRFTIICSILFAGGTFSCLIKLVPITPSGFWPIRVSKFFTAVSSEESKRSVESFSDKSPKAYKRCFIVLIEGEEVCACKALAG